MSLNTQHKITQHQTICNATFKQNMLALQQFLPDLFDYYQKYVPETYHLTVDADLNLNLINSKLNQYIYSIDPVQYTHNKVEGYFQAPKRLVYIPESKKNRDNRHRFLHSFYINRCYEALSAKKKSSNISQDLHQYAPSVVILGLGLGYHIEKMCAEHEIDTLFIYEPESDIFYASLHTIDWQPILTKMCEPGKNITIQVGKDHNAFINVISQFHARTGHYAATRIYLYKHYTSEEINLAIENIPKIIHRMYQGWGFYEDELISIAHTLHNIKTDSFLIKLKELIDRSNINYPPAFIIGNGPSLDNDIEFIKKNQNKFILFSCGSTLKSLYKHGIIPDFHVEIERTKDVYDWLININDLTYIKKIRLLGINNLYPPSIKLFKEFIWGGKFNDAGQKLIYKTFNDKSPETIVNCNPTVTNGALSLATTLGFDEIYLFGVDMAFKDPKYHHSKNSAYFEKEGTFFKEEIRADLSVAGNFVDEIKTNLELDSSRFSLECQLNSHKNIKCFNCSDGAKIAFSTTLKAAEINLDRTHLEKEDFIKKMLEVNTFKLSETHKDKLDRQFHKSYLNIESLIELLKMSLETYPKNRVELGLLFNQQFKWINEMNEKDSLSGGMLLGTLNYMQSCIFCNMVDITDEENFKELIPEAFQFLTDYLNDMLEITQKHYLALDSEIDLIPYFDRADNKRNLA